MAIPLQDSSVEHQVLVGFGSDAPVETPLKERQSVIAWERLERVLGIRPEPDLRPDEPPQAVWSSQLYVEVGKRRLVQAVVNTLTVKEI
jgi:hypothetical protein